MCLFLIWWRKTIINVLLAVSWFRNTLILSGSIHCHCAALQLHGCADVLLSAWCVLMGWFSTDISEISTKPREVLTPFNCWAPVMCWKTLSISCSMRLAQCIILWRQVPACHNTCKRACRDDARFVDSSSTSVRGQSILTEVSWHPAMAYARTESACWTPSKSHPSARLCFLVVVELE